MSECNCGCGQDCNCRSGNGASACNCSEAYNLLAEYMDSQCSVEKRDRLMAHMDECPSCFSMMGIEQEVREIVKTRCHEVAPEDLRDRILGALR